MSKSTVRSKSKHRKATPLQNLDFLNDTGFAMGLQIGMVEEEGSVELDQSELFLDENDSMINLNGIVGTVSGDKPVRNIITDHS